MTRQKHGDAYPCPEALNRQAERAQFDTELDPDSLADAQLSEEARSQHAQAYLDQAVQAASQGRDVDMCEAFDQAIKLDESLAESERDHVLASYRPAKQSVSEEMANQILGHLHLPPLEREDDYKCPYDPNEYRKNEEWAKSCEDYLTVFREGKIPPGTFPVNSPLRKFYEQYMYHPELDEMNQRLHRGPFKKKEETTQAEPA